MRYISVWFFICISLMINEVKYLVIYLLAICIKYLLKFSAHFVIWVFGVFVVVVELFELFIYFGYWHLIKYVICKYFLPFNKLPFHFTYGLLCCAKNFLVWCIPTFIFAFVAFALGVKSKNSLPGLMSGTLLCMVSSGVLWLHFLHLSL